MQVKPPNTKEIWKTTVLWLSKMENDICMQFAQQEITTHPEYPALLAVTDFLDIGGMGYHAVRADTSCIHEFNYPLLANINKAGEEYMYLINNADTWDNEYEITQHWTGIVVYPEKDTQWRNDLNIVCKKNELKNNIIKLTFFLTGITLFIVSSVHLANFPTNAFGLLSLLGLVISMFALGTELGFQSHAVKQVCGAVSDRGCEKVLKSKYAKGIAGITPADLSVLYFAVQFTVYVLGSWYPSLLQAVFLFAFAGVAVAAWSIYTQAVQLNQWCALCLAIVVVLIIQSIIALAVLPPLVTVLPEVLFTGLLIFLAAVLIPIKQLIEINSTNKLRLAELKAWRLDGDLFASQWQQEQAVDTTIWQNDLLLGNPDAPLQITVACNPYCEPCARAYAQLDNLLYRYKDKIKILFRFLCPVEDQTNKITLAVKAILQKAVSLQSNDSLQQMLTDWFKWMDFEKWVQVWQLDNIDVSQQLIKHRQWMHQSNIAFTPTFFINGRKLPGRYSLKDIGHLIPQLADLIISEKAATKIE